MPYEAGPPCLEVNGTLFRETLSVSPLLVHSDTHSPPPPLIDGREKVGYDGMG